MKNLIFKILLIGFVWSSNAQEKSNYFEYLQNSPYGGISNKYVLTLDAYIPDCGEFGGHREVIEIRRIDKVLTATIKIYNSSCRKSNKLPDPNKYSEKSYTLIEEKLKLLDSYLKSILEQSLRYEMVSHADYEYGAKLDWEEKTDFNFKRLDIKFRQYGDKWNKFEELKTELKK